MPRGTLYLYLIQLSKIILSEELCCLLGVREEHLQTCVPSLKEIKKVNAMLRERERTRERERVEQRTGKCMISYCSTEVHNHVIANCCLHMCVRACVRVCAKEIRRIRSTLHRVHMRGQYLYLRVMSVCRTIL